MSDSNELQKILDEMNDKNVLFAKKLKETAQKNEKLERKVADLESKKRDLQVQYNDAIESKREAEKKLEKARLLLNNEYNEVIQEIFEKPRQHLENSIKSESSNSIKKTLLYTILAIFIGIISTVIVSAIYDKKNSNNLLSFKTELQDELNKNSQITETLVEGVNSNLAIHISDLMADLKKDVKKSKSIDSKFKKSTLNKINIIQNQIKSSPKSVTKNEKINNPTPTIKLKSYSGEISILDGLGRELNLKNDLKISQGCRILTYGNSNASLLVNNIFSIFMTQYSELCIDSINLKDIHLFQKSGIVTYKSENTYTNNFKNVYISTPLSITKPLGIMSEVKIDIKYSETVIYAINGEFKACRPCTPVSSVIKGPLIVAGQQITFLNNGGIPIISMTNK